MNKPPPSGLLETRPALAERDDVQHPSNGELPLPAPPARYTQGVHDQIVEHIKNCNRPVVAAGMAGIPSGTFYAWMRKGKEGDPHLWKFAEDVEIAMSIAEGKAVQSIVGPGGNFSQLDSDNAKWWLERTRGAGYSKEVTVKVNALLAEFFETLETSLPPEIFRMVIAAASGHSVVEAKPVFQLEEETSSTQ